MGLKTGIVHCERCVICASRHWKSAYVGEGSSRVVLCQPHFREIFKDKKPGDLLPDNGDYCSNHTILLRKFVDNSAYSAPYTGPLPWKE